MGIGSASRISVLLRTVGIGGLLVVAALLMQGSPPPSPPTTTPGAVSSTTPPASAVVGSAAPPAAGPIPDGFRVRVPRLRIDLPIAEGIVERDVDQQRTPEGYAFHLPGTAIPGQRGNAYVYSHARTGMFLSLWDARVGDEVVIITPDARTLVYVVSEVRPRVAPTDVSVAQPTAEERLTLQTSTGPAPADPRFVVIALPR